MTREEFYGVWKGHIASSVSVPHLSSDCFLRLDFFFKETVKEFPNFKCFYMLVIRGGFSLSIRKIPNNPKNDEAVKDYRGDIFLETYIEREIDRIMKIERNLKMHS